MLFNHRDLLLLNDQLDYIDTAIVPVIPVDYSQKLLKIADEYEMLQYVTLGTEQQFKGRLLVTPPVQLFDALNPVENVTQQLKQYGFKHVVIVCPQTLNIEAENLHKVTVMPLESMDDNMKQEFIQDNVKALMKCIITIWNK
ncbi:DUF2487 family protein [Macrococcus armenti]|uniref:DUF2487 family protein n=1 Tax=Macrococcus armenti TaxID=2875764 RepID=UPI001CCF103D|nr:DUF2487 family protein [Macrococcus armenti]UBH12203.1 YpiF family protein [Macrococcus armenti]